MCGYWSLVGAGHVRVLPVRDHHTGTARRVGAMCARGPRPGESAPAGLSSTSPVTPSFVTVPAPADTRFGPIRRFAEIDSTNRYLLDQARAGAAEGVVAVADYQSAGRGRLGRRWEAPPGSNLLASVLLRPALAADELHLCTVAVALAAVAACERGAGVAAELKWPNDLMVGGRKLAGILAEALPRGPGGRRATVVVVGLGLNVRWPPPLGHAGADARGRGRPDDGVPRCPRAATSIWRLAGRAAEPWPCSDGARGPRGSTRGAGRPRRAATGWPPSTAGAAPRSARPCGCRARGGLHGHGHRHHRRGPSGGRGGGRCPDRGRRRRGPRAGSDLNFPGRLTRWADGGRSTIDPP